MSIPRAIEEHGRGVRSTVALPITGHLAIKLGSFNAVDNSELIGREMFVLSNQDEDIYEIVRILGGKPNWYDLRRAYLELERKYAMPSQRSSMAKKLGIEPKIVDDLFSCMSRPGHDRRYNAGYPIKKREFSLEQATAMIRQIAHQLICGN